MLSCFFARKEMKWDDFTTIGEMLLKSDRITDPATFEEGQKRLPLIFCPISRTHHLS